MGALTLYELASEYATACAILADEETDEQAIADTLEGLRGSLETKAVNVGKFCRNLDVLAEQIKQAEQRLRARRQFIEARRDRVVAYLKGNLEAVNLPAIETPELTLKVKKNPPSVVIDDPAKVPARFLIVPETPPPAPDKRAIGEALKQGEDVPGAHLDTTKTRLEIRP